MELFQEQLHTHRHSDSRYCHPVDPGSTTAFVQSDFPPGAPQIAEVCNPVPQVTVAVFRMFPAPLIELALHVEEPGFISLIIQVHGCFLRLRHSVGSLPAFATYTAFPRSDYYAGSAPSIHQSPVSVASPVQFSLSAFQRIVGTRCAWTDPFNSGSFLSRTASQRPVKSQQAKGLDP